VTGSRRERAEWDEFAREQPSRRRRALARIGLSLVGVGALTFIVVSAMWPGSSVAVAIVAGLLAAAGWGAVLLRRAERTAKGWGGKPVAARWVNPPRRGGRRR
jgi:hypothetical protein